MTTEVQLNADQQMAVDSICSWVTDADPDSYKFTLAGLAGTGKTTILPNIIRRVHDSGFRRISVCAPTGKAASVINSKLSGTLDEIGAPKAVTIHKLAYLLKGNRVNEERKDHLGRDTIEPVFEGKRLDADLVIVDESSMVDNSAYDHLASMDSRYLFVGDHGQLPPVGCKTISPAMATRDYTLRQIMRQQEGSGILRLAHHVRDGGRLTDRVDAADVHQLWADSTHAVARHCFDHDIELIIAATNKMRHAINQRMRTLHGFDSTKTPGEGEKIQLYSTCYPRDIFNGELYRIAKVRSQQDHPEGPLMLVDLADVDTGEVVAENVDMGFQWRAGIAIEEGVTAFEPGYCITCHKSQGSQADRVAVINEPIGWMERGVPAWRYTAVTRAAKDLTVFTLR